MRWSKHLEDCLTSLQNEKGVPTDISLVYMVRMQMICNNVIVTPSGDWASDYPITISRDTILSPLKLQFETLRRSMPIGLQDNRGFRPQFLVTC